MASQYGDQTSILRTLRNTIERYRCKETTEKPPRTRREENISANHPKKTLPVEKSRNCRSIFNFYNLL